jgi:O-antigen ligase
VAVKRWIKAITNLVVILIIWSDRESLGALRKLLPRLAFILIPVSILFYKYYPNLGRGYGEWDGQLMITGVTLNKNTLGAVCMCLGIGLLWLILMTYNQKRTKGRKKALGAQFIVLAMVVWLLWITNSMTALSCFLMAAILLIVTHSGVIIRRPRLVHVVIVSMLLVSVSIGLLGVSPETLQSMGRNPTLTDRTLVWKSIVTLVPNGLVGTGFESFWLGPRLTSMWEKFRWLPNEAHNGYLEIYANLGWLGIVLLALVLVTGYRAAFRSWRNRVPSGSLCLAYILVGLTYNLTEAAFFRLCHPVWLFVLFGIVNVRTRRHDATLLPERRSVEESSVRTVGELEPVLHGIESGFSGSHDTVGPVPLLVRTQRPPFDN